MKFLQAAIMSAMIVSPVSLAHATISSDDPEVLVKDGEFFGEIRYRYEHVEQDGFDKDAQAHTVRTEFGFKTGVYNGFQGLIAAQVVQNIGDNDFNSTTNGNTTYPIIADPNVTEINELWLSWSGLPQTSVKIGRQKLGSNNQRFIGGVAWRQNDQTYDAITVKNSRIENLDLKYSYVGNVNRIFGDDHPQGDLDSSIHLMDVKYKFADWLTIAGYGYLMEFDLLPARSAQTFGLRATGKLPLSDDWTFLYEAEMATQEDYKNNTASYDEEYYHIAPAIKGYGFMFKAGYEVLGGDGTDAFQTPLATAHKYNGWADAFLNIPAAGLEDAYISASYQLNDTNTLFDNTKFTIMYHNFDSNDSSSGDYGEELDLLVGKTFDLPDTIKPFKSLGVSLKYADYDGDSGIVDRNKVWLQFGLKF